jgi:transposase
MFPEGTATRTAVLMKQAKTVADYRRILCVHLRAAFGESNPVIAAKTGLSESTIRKVHAAFLRRGEAALTTRPRGGRRRAHLTVAEEAAVVQPFLAKALTTYQLIYAVPIFSTAPPSSSASYQHPLAS